MAKLVHAGSCQPLVKHPDGEVERFEQGFYVIKDLGDHVEIFQRMTGRTVSISCDAEVVFSGGG